MRSLHEVAFSRKLRWLTQTKVITLKTQLHAVAIQALDVVMRHLVIFYFFRNLAVGKR